MLNVQAEEEEEDDDDDGDDVRKPVWDSWYWLLSERC